MLLELTQNVLQIFKLSDIRLSLTADQQVEYSQRDVVRQKQLYT